MPETKLGKKARIVSLVFILLVLLGAAYGIAGLMLRGGRQTLLPTRNIDSIIAANLEACDVYTPDARKNFVLKQNGKYEWEQIEVVLRVDPSFSLPALTDALKAEPDLSNLEIVEETTQADPSTVEHHISIYFEDVPLYQLLILQPVPIPAPEPIAPEERRPRIAIIVDDAGYDLDRALTLLNLRCPLSISILPKLKYSRHIAEVAHEMGYEVMMHLPMESDRNLRKSPGFITAEMTQEEISWVLDRDFESIPYVIGVNNHQGSMMTRDRDSMIRVMTYLAEKNVFFVDSRTTSDSIAYQIAKELGLRAAENDVFLDNEKDVEYIKGRFELLMREARQKGKAIGICHVHPVTTKALFDMVPLIEEKGIDLVFASELVE